ncbi:neutral/alkaline non-lysosomal ceramidase N-terminal domain-containing protein [Paenibacillus hodogayensis]|uniref:Neutral/alkaline non-lysosomal ceramidase N-terminal domain-containing protein n=1 Tax=Paenibacillus hodogayensis TaxID=279208 RepID=A0ABV5VTQ0_9BACL
MSEAVELLLGTAKIDITPEQPVPLAGFGHRKGPFEGINRRLFVRVNVFEQGEGAARRRVLIAQGDIIWWGSERMEGIRLALGERFGIGASDIILSAQHTHGGPQTTTLFCDTLGLPDSAYLERLDGLLLRGVEEAVAGLEPVTAERGVGECRIGINRRKFVGGVMAMAPNFDGLFDPAVNVVRFRRGDGSAKAVFVHYACHPTTTNTNFVTSEYPGAAAERLEATLGCGTVVSFLQGCTGNIRPALHRENKFYAGSERDVARLGRALANEVERVLAMPMQPLAAAPVTGRRIVAQLPFQTVPTQAEIDGAIAQGGVRAEWGEKLRSPSGKLGTHIPFELTFIRLAEQLSFLAMDGEVVLEYGDYIKRLAGNRTLPMGYSNGMVGYVPTAAQIAEGGYEGKESAVYFALPAAFAPETEIIIRQAIEELIREED